MSTVFIGDSHLARARRSLALITTNVDNRAVGGATVADVPSQLTPLSDHTAESVVLSIGTNDAAPARGVELDAFRGGFTEILDMLHPLAVTYLAPPGVIESRLPMTASWTNATIHRYRLAALDICRLRNIPTIRADHVLASLGPKAFAQDGLHLSGIGYRALLPVINAAIAAS